MYRRPHLLPIALLTSVMASLATVPPAAADQSAESAATVTLVAGGLSITAPADVGNLASQPSQTGAHVVSGNLGQVTVTDVRGAGPTANWTASAISTAFTPTSGGTAIGAGAVGYTAGEIGKTGTATYTAHDPATLTGVSPVVTASDIVGNNTATWNPTITIRVPAAIGPGVYRATITHSVL